MHNLSLVLFTVLSQAAVGLVLLSTILLYQLKPQEAGGLTKALRNAGRLAFPLAVVGVIASVFHLGDPMGGYRALNNLGSSWLSREILFMSLFTAGTAVGFYLWQYRPTELGAIKATGVVTALLGLVTILATGMVYQLPTRPEWNHWANLLAGLITALLLGSLLLALLALTAAESTPAALATMGWTALAAVALLLVSLAFYAPYLAAVPGPSASLLFANPWFWARLLVGVGLPLVAATRLLKGERPASALVAVALVAALGGELVAHSLFYSTVLQQLPIF